ncbi:MAG: hypothetical protein WA755_09805 [Candidatus Acidiferrales bacterium]
MAARIPFGIYKLRVEAEGFWSAEKEVRVFQPDTWAIVGLELGMGKLEGGLSTYELSGSLRNLGSSEPAVWARLSGVFSQTVVDAKVSDSGNFAIAGMPQGLYVLVITQGGKILFLGDVAIPFAGPLVIDLRKWRESASS